MIQCNVETKCKYYVRPYESDTTNYVVKIKKKKKIKNYFFFIDSLISTFLFFIPYEI